MKPFLKQVAEKYHSGGDIESRCFIFPNRRSEVFFLKYLAETVRSAAEHADDGTAVPCLVPGTCTMNDFICSLQDFPVADRITQLLVLYESYGSLNRSAESLDEFIFWGDIILGDFNDVDKYLADPGQLFANVEDFKSIQDTFSYLTDTQRRAVESFVGHFRDDSGRLTVDLKSDNPKVKEKFLQIWNILHPMYMDFNRRMTEKSLAYEGRIYRTVAQNVSSGKVRETLSARFPNSRKFIFVGLNALNECEKKIMSGLYNEGLAEFCWDYSGDMIRNRFNKSSFFMRENVRNFPQAFELDAEGTAVPEIRVISVPSAVGQVKQLPAIFESIARKCTGGDLSAVGVLEPGGNGADCAVVLPDENLLMPVLNTVPPEIRHINVTMGYPVSASAFYSYMDIVMSLHMNVRKKDGIFYFYHKQVYALFANPIFRKAAGGRGRELEERVRKQARPYVSAEELSAPGLPGVIFNPGTAEKLAGEGDSSAALLHYLKDVIEETVPHVGKTGTDIVEREFAAEYYKTLGFLDRIGAKVKPKTFAGLLRRILAPVSVPFKGEPLRGLQIMGPLETRALDFENLIILSANEGVFPRKSVSSSFIPPELRKGFGLPTYEYQDSVWAYYFYRMLTRAKRVWLLYDSRTEGIRSGEESRYIKQLRYHFNVPVESYVVSAALSDSASVSAIPKTAADVGLVREMTFSATSLKTYLSCRAKFYYKYLRGLEAGEEIAEDLDNGLFGVVYHSAMHCLYLGDEAMERDIDPSDKNDISSLGPSPDHVGRDYLVSWLGRPDRIRRKVRSLMMKTLHTLEISGRNLVICDVIARFVMKTISSDIRVLDGSGAEGFAIYGLEKKYFINFKGFRIGGTADRIDGIRPGTVRIVDYKTGSVKDEDCRIDSSNAEKVAGAVFAADNSKRPEIALQLYLYDKLVRSDARFSGMSVENSIYSTRNMFSAIPETYPVCPEFIEKMDEGLERLFNEMTDESVPFSLTDDAETCKYCDFKIICGR